MRRIFAKIKKSKIYRAIFGYDIFISYSRIDSLDYAYSIAQYFLKKRYECYIDQLSSSTPGKELPENIQDAVKNSTSFILIGSIGAQASISIKDEINLFLLKNKNQPLIPITIENAISKDCIWFFEIDGLALIDDTAENLKKGSPSNDVLSRIESALKFTKKGKRLRVIAISILVGVLAIVSGGIVYTSKTINEANSKVSKAELKESDANVKTNIANLQKIHADSLATIAKIEAVKALKQKDVADSLKTIALAQTKVAKVQKQNAIDLRNDALKDAHVYDLMKQSHTSEFPNIGLEKALLSFTTDSTKKDVCQNLISVFKRNPFIYGINMKYNGKYDAEGDFNIETNNTLLLQESSRSYFFQLSDTSSTEINLYNYSKSIYWAHKNYFLVHDILDTTASIYVILNNAPLLFKNIIMPPHLSYQRMSFIGKSVFFVVDSTMLNSSKLSLEIKNSENLHKSKKLKYEIDNSSFVSWNIIPKDTSVFIYATFLTKETEGYNSYETIVYSIDSKLNIDSFKLNYQLWRHGFENVQDIILFNDSIWGKTLIISFDHMLLSHVKKLNRTSVQWEYLKTRNIEKILLLNPNYLIAKTNSAIEIRAINVTNESPHYLLNYTYQCSIPSANIKDIAIYNNTFLSCIYLNPTNNQFELLLTGKISDYLKQATSEDINCNQINKFYKENCVTLKNSLR